MNLSYIVPQGSISQKESPGLSLGVIAPFMKEQSILFLYIVIGRCGVSANETTLHPNNSLKK